MGMNSVHNYRAGDIVNIGGIEAKVLISGPTNLRVEYSNGKECVIHYLDVVGHKSSRIKLKFAD
jgi:hypothetical protein